MSNHFPSATIVDSHGAMLHYELTAEDKVDLCMENDDVFHLPALADGRNLSRLTVLVTASQQGQSWNRGLFCFSSNFGTNISSPYQVISMNFTVKMNARKLP